MYSTRDIQIIKKIKYYCSEIANDIKRYGDSLNVFKSDGSYYRSVSMSIMQIGELSNNLSDEFRKSTADYVPWNAIRGMRNHFAHGYDYMNAEEIFATAEDDIPYLLSKCDKFIEEYDNSLKT